MEIKEKCIIKDLELKEGRVRVRVRVKDKGKGKG